MALSAHQIADPELVEKLNQRLVEFRKLRVGYISDSDQSSGKVIEKKVKEVKKRSIIERFFFSEYK